MWGKARRLKPAKETKDTIRRKPSEMTDALAWRRVGSKFIG